jgi:hypothetical protein
LLIVLFAAIEFGMFFASMQQVALACRVGAEEASQTNLSGTVDGDPVPSNVSLAVEQQLATAGYVPCAVFLQHDVQDPPQMLVTPASPTCPCLPPADALLPPPGAGGKSVRVTVCVPMTELAPNCLALFGFDLADRCAQCTTTFRYELSTP